MSWDVMSQSLKVSSRCNAHSSNQLQVSREIIENNKKNVIKENHSHDNQWGQVDLLVRMNGPLLWIVFGVSSRSEKVRNVASSLYITYFVWGRPTLLQWVLLHCTYEHFKSAYGSFKFVSDYGVVGLTMRDSLKKSVLQICDVKTAYNTLKVTIYRYIQFFIKSIKKQMTSDDYYKQFFNLNSKNGTKFVTSLSPIIKKLKIQIKQIMCQNDSTSKWHYNV